MKFFNQLKQKFLGYSRYNFLNHPINDFLNNPKHDLLDDQLKFCIKNKSNFNKMNDFLIDVLQQNGDQLKYKVQLLGQYNGRIKGSEQLIIEALKINPDYQASKFLKKKQFNKKILKKNKSDLLKNISYWVNEKSCNNSFNTISSYDIQGLFYNLLPYINDNDYKQYQFNDVLDKIYKQYNTTIDQESLSSHTINDCFFVDSKYIHNEFYQKALINTIKQTNTKNCTKVDDHINDLMMDFLNQKINYCLIKYKLNHYFSNVIIEDDKLKMKSLSSYKKLNNESFIRVRGIIDNNRLKTNKNKNQNKENQTSLQEEDKTLFQFSQEIFQDKILGYSPYPFNGKSLSEKQREPCIHICITQNDKSLGFPSELVQYFEPIDVINKNDLNQTISSFYKKQKEKLELKQSTKPQENTVQKKNKKYYNNH